jgi:hypothetical protein
VGASACAGSCRDGRDPEAAWKAIEEILAGKSDAAKAPKLAAQLDTEHKALLSDKLADLAKIAAGDVVLEVGELIGANKSAVVNQAMSAARGKPSAAKLQRFVVELDGANLDALSDAHALELERLFAGKRSSRCSRESRRKWS